MRLHLHWTTDGAFLVLEGAVQGSWIPVHRPERERERDGSNHREAPARYVLEEHGELRLHKVLPGHGLQLLLQEAGRCRMHEELHPGQGWNHCQLLLIHLWWMAFFFFVIFVIFDILFHIFDIFVSSSSLFPPFSLFSTSFPLFPAVPPFSPFFPFIPAFSRLFPLVFLRTSSGNSRRFPFIPVYSRLFPLIFLGASSGKLKSSFSPIHKGQQVSALC